MELVLRKIEVSELLLFEFFEAVAGAGESGGKVVGSVLVCGLIVVRLLYIRSDIGARSGARGKERGARSGKHGL